MRRGADRGPRAQKALRRVRRRRRDRLRRRARRDLRLPRPERRRQELDDADDRRGLARERRHPPRPRPRPRAGRAGDPGAARGRPAGGQPRPRAQRRREPAGLRPLLRPAARRDQAAERGAARLRAAGRPPRRKGGVALGRDEAAADNRAGAHQHARADAAGRADHRARPAGPPCALGPSIPAQAAGRDARPDDALHGRGRAALRPARDHGPREDRGGGVAARAHRPASSSARWWSFGSGRRTALRLSTTSASTSR